MDWITFWTIVLQVLIATAVLIPVGLVVSFVVGMVRYFSVTDIRRKSQTDIFQGGTE